MCRFDLGLLPRGGWAVILAGRGPPQACSPDLTITGRGQPASSGRMSNTLWPWISHLKERPSLEPGGGLRDLTQ